jgi:XTP/dITP diphosphohydrolase
MQKLVLASANKHKIKEFKAIFKGYEIVPMSEFGFTEDIEENGKNFLENAIIKAKAVNKFLKAKGIELPVIADDSGLCVDALGGEPGVMSARYAGGHDNKEANRALLLEKLKNKDNRDAHFNCTIVMYMPNDDCIFAEGKTEGTILRDNVYYMDPNGSFFGNFLYNMVNLTGRMSTFIPYTSQYLTYFNSLGVEVGSEFYAVENPDIHGNR